MAAWLSAPSRSGEHREVLARTIPVRPRSSFGAAAERPRRTSKAAPRLAPAAFARTFALPVIRLIAVGRGVAASGRSGEELRSCRSSDLISGARSSPAR
mgnify:CR=1 FL=1